MICSVCSRLLDISPSTIAWLSIGTVFFFKQGRYVYKNIMGCKQILHNKLLSPMTESIASLGKPLRSMIFQILISPQVLLRPIKKINPGYENIVHCALRNVTKPSMEQKVQILSQLNQHENKLIYWRYVPNTQNRNKSNYSKLAPDSPMYQTQNTVFCTLLSGVI